MKCTLCGDDDHPAQALWENAEHEYAGADQKQFEAVIGKGISALLKESKILMELLHKWLYGNI